MLSFTALYCYLLLAIAIHCYPQPLCYVALLMGSRAQGAAQAHSVVVLFQVIALVRGAVLRGQFRLTPP